MTQQLSLAAQAVAKAALKASSFCIEEACPYKGEEIAAVLLRAAADQVVPDESDIWTRDLRGDAWIRWAERKRIRRDILAIADELKAQ